MPHGWACFPGVAIDAHLLKLNRRAFDVNGLFQAVLPRGAQETFHFLGAGGAFGVAIVRAAGFDFNETEGVAKVFLFVPRDNVNLTGFFPEDDHFVVAPGDPVSLFL